MSQGVDGFDRFAKLIVAVGGDCLLGSAGGGGRRDQRTLCVVIEQSFLPQGVKARNDPARAIIARLLRRTVWMQCLDKLATRVVDKPSDSSESVGRGNAITNRIVFISQLGTIRFGLQGGVSASVIGPSCAASQSVRGFH